jgi:hypothetical protein
LKDAEQFTEMLLKPVIFAHPSKNMKVFPDIAGIMVVDPADLRLTPVRLKIDVVMLLAIR